MTIFHVGDTSPSGAVRGLPHSLTAFAIAAVILGGFVTPIPVSAQSVSLGTATPFGVLAAAAITNTGVSTIHGDLGIHPNNASSVTGFTFSTPPDAGQVIGATHFADSVALAAQNDVTTSYNTLAGLPCDATVAADLGGLTLTSGVYCSGSSMGLTGTLTLDAQGDPDAVFVFQVGSQLTTASNSTVHVINGAQSCNVFWQIGSSATLGTGTNFLGSILALTSISLDTGAAADGRLLARNGAVTLDSADVTVCTLLPPLLVAPAISKAFLPDSIPAGGVSTLTITLINADTSNATLTAALTDTLPTGVFIASIPNAATTCAGSGTIDAVAGSGSVTMSAGHVIPAGGTCSLSVDTTGFTGGTYLNTIQAGSLVTTTGSNPSPALATLVIVPPIPGPPLVAKSFSPASVVAGASSTLTITLSNPSGIVATLTAPFVDTLPGGLIVASPPLLFSDCGGTGGPFATAGGGSVTLPAGRSIPANGSCIIRVDVTSAVAGTYVNSIPAGALVTSNGSNADPAVATLIVTLLPPIIPYTPLPVPLGGIEVLAVLALLLIVAAYWRSGRLRRQVARRRSR